VFKCDILEFILLRINYNTTLLNKINIVTAPVLNIQPQNTEFKQEHKIWSLAAVKIHQTVTSATAPCRMQSFRLFPRYTWGLRSSRMLRSVGW